MAEPIKGDGPPSTDSAAAAEAAKPAATTTKPVKPPNPVFRMMGKQKSLQRTNEADEVRFAQFA